jgi:hypothetical protein
LQPWVCTLRSRVAVWSNAAAQASHQLQPAPSHDAAICVTGVT